MGQTTSEKYISILLFIITLAVVLYVSITTILLWYKAGLILNFVVANLFVFIFNNFVNKKIFKEFKDRK